MSEASKPHIERYGWIGTHLEPDPTGQWVKWNECQSLVEQLEAMREALTLIADYGHEMDDYVMPPKQARKIAREALNPATNPHFSQGSAYDGSGLCQEVSNQESKP